MSARSVDDATMQRVIRRDYGVCQPCWRVGLVVDAVSVREAPSNSTRKKQGGPQLEAVCWSCASNSGALDSSTK